MLNKLIQFSVRNKLIIGLCTIGLIIWGTLNVLRLPIDALPDITSNQVQVITVSPSLAAPEVERLVTFPIEQVNANIPGIDEIRSISRFGLSVVTIVFNDKTDLYWARQQVSERINQVRDQIPASAGRPELAPVTTGLGEVYQYILRPAPGFESKYDLTELRTIQDWIVRKQLLGTPGVADVSSFGGYLKQYEVAIIPAKLKSMGVTLDDLFTALEKNNENSGGAYIEKGQGSLFIRTEGLVKDPEDLKKIVVRHHTSGLPVFLRDVAEVRIGHAVRYGAMTYQDKGEVAGGVVLMLKGANASAVIKDVKKRIASIQKTLPEGVILEPFYDRTKMVSKAMSTVEKNLLEGALIVIFILVLFLGNLRAGLIVASVIPLSMLFAVIMMNLFGVSGNLMSLGALDFGLIVDGAVIIVEAVIHRLSHSKHLNKVIHITQGEMDNEVQASAGKMMNSAVFGQIVILIVYLPILSLVGIEGKMFKPMALTVSFALIGAFLLSLTYVPMISSVFLSKKISHKENWSDKLMKWIHGLYRPVLNLALRFPKSLVLTVVLVFGLSLFIMSRLGGEFIPELEEGDFAVDARLLTGSSLSETIRNSTRAAAILQQFPEVEKIVTRIGASEIPTDPMPVEMTDIIISLKPKEEWTTASSSDELANKMSEALQVIPGMTSGFQFPVQMRFNELISGARQDVVCKIFGDDLDSLAAYAQELGALVHKVNGAKDIYIETVTGLPQVVINYRREALAHYQLNVADVNRAVRTAFAGESAGLVFEQEKRFDLVVRLDENSRQDLHDVEQLLIASPIGIQIPLYQVASVEIKEGPNQVQRENTRRRIIVGFNVRGRDVKSAVKELEEKVGAQLKMDPGYTVKYGGQFENLVEASNRLAIAVPAALLLILVMLYFAFGSLRYGVLIFSAIPLSAIGGVIGLWIRGMPFSISAGVGFIALFGVAVLNGIVLIAEFNRLKKHGLHDLNMIIMEGTKIRLRPVIMTAAVASLGFLPMALSHGVGAEVQRPLATVVIGGLISATFLTLVVLPVLYRWVEKLQFRSKAKHIEMTIVLALFIFPATAQTNMPERMSLEQMHSLADKQNLRIKAMEKEQDYWKAMQGGVFDPSKTMIGMEYGNINSFNNDTRFTINQSFSLPAVYQRQRDLYRSEEGLKQVATELQKSNLHREITLLYYDLALLEERATLLNRIDSIYSRILRAAELRYKTGESNILEKTSAEAQMQYFQLQRQEIESDQAKLMVQLARLLHVKDPVQPIQGLLRLKAPVLTDSIPADQHPLGRLGKQEELLAGSRVAVERSRLLPEWGLGYSNQSIIGFQSPDGINQTYYGGGERFHTVGLNIAVPLFNKATRSRIKAAREQEKVASINRENAQEYLRSEWQHWTMEYLKQGKFIDYFETTGLKQSDLIIKNAKLAFDKGEISYLEWSQLMRNAMEIQLNYLQALRLNNHAAAELNYLSGK